MDFSLSEEQLFLQSTVKNLLETECSLDTVRQDAKDGTTKNQPLFDSLTSLGVHGTLIDEEFGGVGLKLIEAALIAEVLGGNVATVPFMGNSVIAPLAIKLAGSDEQKNEWLPKIASGETTVGVALGEHVGARDNTKLESNGNSISGSAMFALETDGADSILVASQTGTLHLVNTDEIEITQLFTIDKTRSVAKLEFDSAGCESLESADDPGAVLSQIIDAGRIVIAADTLGAAQTMLEKSIDYAGERRQFNRVIGSFQAVKHMCAEMAAELEPCRSLIWYAAHAFDSIPEDARLTACHAKAHLAEVGRFVARKSTEVHGGMGFTDLLGLHYWFKRIELNRQLLGTPEFVRNEAAKLQEWL